MSENLREDGYVNLAFADRFAEQAHTANVTWSGDPYILHPRQVMQFTQLSTGLIAATGELERFSGFTDLSRTRLHPQAQSEGMHDEDLHQGALLHDVVEDTEWTLEGLTANGFSPGVVNLVDIVSQRKGESKEVFFRRIMNSGLIAARMLKLADVWHNLDPSRVPDEKTEKFYEKSAIRYCGQVYEILGFDEQVEGAISESYPELESRAHEMLRSGL